MSVYVQPVGGAGFEIDADDLRKLKARFEVEWAFELFGYDEEGVIALPNGFEFCPFDGPNEEERVLIIADIGPALTNPVLMPDWSIAQAWAKKWLIKFTEDKPNLHIYQYSH